MAALSGFGKAGRRTIAVSSIVCIQIMTYVYISVGPVGALARARPGISPFIHVFPAIYF
jgi:hypothetical protein